MPDRAPAASSVQETIVVSKMRGNLVIFNQDNFMNHETLIIKKDKETLLLTISAEFSTHNLGLGGDG